jgi:response regulator RpfG family c-di-GMP phosphodiesterase
MIVDPDLTTRTRLKAATSSVPKFNSASMRNSPWEALEAFKGNGDKVDIVFISYHCDSKECERLVAEAKQLPASQDAAFIFVSGSKDQDKNTVATQVMQGYDGFLFEPYSVDALVQITELATKVKTDREAARQILATKLITSDLMSQIDLVADLKSHGYGVTKSAEKLKELGSSYQKMVSEASSKSSELAHKLFMDAPVPQEKVKGPTYKGTSERVRRRMEAKALRNQPATKADKKG